MAYSTINVGTVANDGTGDALRTAFGKVNTNFGLTPLGNSTAADPTVNSDSSAGYSVGSLWLNTSTHARWVCVNNSVGAAKWLLSDYADHPGYVANMWFNTRSGPTGTGAVLVLNTARFIPWVAKGRLTLSALGARITTAGAAGAKVDLAIYASTPPTTLQRPTGLLLANTGDIVATSTGVVNGAISQQIEPGLYWLGINTNDSTIICQATSNAGLDVGALIGSATQATVMAGTCLTAVTTPLTYGTWGDLSAATWTEIVTNATAAITIKAGTVP